MFVKSIAPALALVLITAGVAGAQQGGASAPTRIQQFQAWGAYSYKFGNSTVCYVLSVPTSKEPASVDHGDIFFIISQRPGQNISYEPQAMVGYELQAGSKVTINIDNRVFTLFTKGKSAWLENAAEEPALINAMRTGKAMTMGAVSKRGTKTGYVFSLQGISAALKKIEGCQ